MRGAAVLNAPFHDVETGQYPGLQPNPDLMAAGKGSFMAPKTHRGTMGGGSAGGGVVGGERFETFGALERKVAEERKKAANSAYAMEGARFPTPKDMRDFGLGNPRR